MSRFWFAAAALLFAAPALADDDRRWGREELPDNAVALDGEDLRDRLDRIADLMDEAAWEKSFKKRQRMVNEARQELNELRRIAHRAPELRPRRQEQPPPVVHHPPARPPPTTNVPPPPPGAPQPPAHRYAPIADQAFRNMCRAIQQESFGRERLRVLESASRTRWFLVSHVKEVLASFDFPREKLKAVQILKARTLDSENLYELYEAFTFTSDKAELKRILDS